MSEFVYVTLTIPSAFMGAANRVAAVFDFDEGGGDTFGSCPLSATGDEPATHYMCNTAIKPHYIGMLTDPVQALAALTQLAALYEREAPSEADVTAFCTNVIVGEPDGLVRVVDGPL